jgi:hypothetical protein
MSLDRRSTSNRHPRTKKNPRGLPRTQQAQSLWTRTPRTRRSYSPCLRGMARTRPKTWTQSQSPHGGLARQIHHLDGSRGTPLGPIRGQTHCQDGQVVGPRRRRAVQACRVGSLAAMRVHLSAARAPSRHSHGRMRPPRSATHSHGQRVPLGLLLAHCGR